MRSGIPRTVIERFDREPGCCARSATLIEMRAENEHAVQLLRRRDDVLRDMEGLTDEEVAEITGLHVGTCFNQR